MTCGETTDHDTGQLGEDEVGDSQTWQADNCLWHDISSSWDHLLGTTAKDGSRGYDKIWDKKRWWVKSYWTNKPDALLDNEDCNHSKNDCTPSYPECDEPRPISVTYEIEHGTSTTADYYLKFPKPDGDEDDSGGTDDGIFQTAFAVIGAVSNYKLVSAGAALISSYIDTNASDPITLDYQKFSNGDKEEWLWDIQMNGINREDFPDKPCETSGVKITVDNRAPSQTTHNVYVWDQQTFRLPTYADQYCPCAGFTTVDKTTHWALNVCDYESVSQDYQQ